MRVATSLARLFPVAMIAFAAASCGSDTPDGPSGLPVLKNSIVFGSDRSGESQIWVMNADGSNARMITNFLGPKFSPDVSPDGTHIVFTAVADSVTLSVFTINSDGTGLKRLITTPGSYASPVWSRTGDQIAYVVFSSDDSDVQDIFVMNSDGSGQTDLTNNPQRDNHPSWALHRDLILFDSDRDPPGRAPTQIYVTTPGGSDVRLVTIGEQPSWSPSGGRIVFLDANGNVSTAFADGSGVSPITDSLTNKFFPHWSPDESTIVFEHKRDILDPIEIWVEGTDGSNLHPLTTAADGENYNPTYTRR
jgi:Tol biopolymer transport system component